MKEVLGKVTFSSHDPKPVNKEFLRIISPRLRSGNQVLLIYHVNRNKMRGKVTVFYFVDD